MAIPSFLYRFCFWLNGVGAAVGLCLLVPLPAPAPASSQSPSICRLAADRHGRTSAVTVGRSSVGVRRVPSADLQGGGRWGRAQAGEQELVGAWPRGAKAQSTGTTARRAARARRRMAARRAGGSAAAGGGGWRHGGSARRRMAARTPRRDGWEASRMQYAAWCLPYCLWAVRWVVVGLVQ